MKFEIAYGVTLDHPIDGVFPVLALAPDTERVLRLSSLVTHFKLVSDEVGPPHVITFEFGEKVYGSKVTMRVEQTVDPSAYRVDYRSRTKGGTPLTVHKIRTFTADGDRTRVDEVIHGDAVFGIHWLARRTARKAHIEHMNSYYRLFG